MENQKPVQELVELLDLRLAELQPGQRPPLALSEGFYQLLAARTQAGLGQVRLQAEFAEQLRFESQESFGRRQVIQKAAHQIKNGGYGRFRFGRLANQRRAVRSLPEISQLAS